MRVYTSIIYPATPIYLLNYNYGIKKILQTTIPNKMSLEKVLSPAKTILIIDEHCIVAEVLKKYLESKFPLDRFEVASDMQKTNQIINGTKIDLIITETNISELDGISFFEHLKKITPTTNILVFTAKPNLIHFNRTKEVYVKGLVSKNSTTQSLIEAINKIKSGGQYWEENNMNYDQAKPSHKQQETVLSARELEIFNLITENITSKEIASKLFISIQTVNSHRKNIIRKTGCRTPLEMLKLKNT